MKEKQSLLKILNLHSVVIIVVVVKKLSVAELQLIEARDL
jgi:hypothetical protein